MRIDRRSGFLQAALLAALGLGLMSTAPNDDDDDDRPSQFSYKFTERVQLKFLAGVPVVQFNLIDLAPTGFSIGDQVIFSSDLEGVDARGNRATGTMRGRCLAAGVEERNPPLCTAFNADGSCAFLETRSPLFICEQVLRLVDPQRGIDGFSQLTLQGFVRQLEAQGAPPGQNQRSQWLAVTGGTGRFKKARGQVKVDLFETVRPPPIKEVVVYVKN